MKGAIYSAMALVVMASFAVGTLFSFDDAFILRGFKAVSRLGIAFQLGYVAANVLLVAVVLLAFYGGARMWRAESWQSGDRTISGMELKMEAAVPIGLGFTLVFVLVRGFF